jgi:hypothetical protein
VRDRETISGDLLEEYREERLPRLGRIRANAWYLRQLISFASIQIVGGPHVKRLLMLICLFTAAAAVWLAIMENILKHNGYPERTAIAACIALQSLSTMLFVVLGGRAIFRAVILTGGAGVGLLGALAIGKVLQARHFEGYALVIALALILQGVLTLVVLIQVRGGKTA